MFCRWDCIKDQHLSPLVMDRPPGEVRQKSPKTDMVADDVVICSETRWRYDLEGRGMKISCRGCEEPKWRLQGTEVKVKEAEDNDV